MASGPVKIRRTSEFMSCLIAEERERSECSIGLPVRSYSRAATEPPPTFPFLESQCQRAALRHELLLCQRSKAARKNEPRRAARTGYIGRWLRRVKRESGQSGGFFAASDSAANPTCWLSRRFHSHHSPLLCAGLSGRVSAAVRLRGHRFCAPPWLPVPKISPALSSNSVLGFPPRVRLGLQRPYLFRTSPGALPKRRRNLRLK